MESYKERTAKQSQTLTGLGKWWGRKPLVLCRATILGLLLPATDNPQKDRDVFLRLMPMDDDGLLLPGNATAGEGWTTRLIETPETVTARRGNDVRFIRRRCRAFVTYECIDRSARGL